MNVPQPSLRRQALRLFLVWLALITLMLASLGSAYIPLGAGNALAGIFIALLKAALVAWCFMDFREATTLIRITVAMALLILILLFELSGVDYATRTLYRAPWQTPTQLPQPDLNRQGRQPGNEH